MKVSNMTSPRSHNKVANQFIIETDDFTVFQSYQTTIARQFKTGHVELDENWDWSNTTRKYLYKFLDCDRKTLLNRIKSGEYEIVKLNETA